MVKHTHHPDTQKYHPGALQPSSHEFFFLASDCKGLLRPIGVTLYKLGESNLLAHINELRGEGAQAASDRNTWGKEKGKKYVKMTKADAMLKLSGGDETLKMERLPSDEREQSSFFPPKSSDYTNANQTDKHKRTNK